MFHDFRVNPWHVRRNPSENIRIPSEEINKMHPRLLPQAGANQHHMLHISIIQGNWYQIFDWAAPFFGEVIASI